MSYSSRNQYKYTIHDALSDLKRMSGNYGSSNTFNSPNSSYSSPATSPSVYRNSSSGFSSIPISSNTYMSRGFYGDSQNNNYF